jgi:hypothetical protein
MLVYNKRTEQCTDPDWAVCGWPWHLFPLRKAALPLEMTRYPLCTGGWERPRAGLDGCVKFAPTGTRSLDVQPIASRNNLYAIAPCLTLINLRSAHRVYLYVLCECQNKQRLLPYTSKLTAFNYKSINSHDDMYKNFLHLNVNQHMLMTPVSTADI